MILPPWLPASTLIKGVAIAAVLITFFVLGVTASNQVWEARWQKRNAEEAERNLQVANNIADLEQEARRREKFLIKERQAIEEDYATKVEKLSKDVSTARTDGARLRNTITEYSSRPSGSTSSTCTDDDRAKTLGILLNEAYGAAEEGLGDAAKYSDQIRALKAYIRRVCFNAANSTKVVPAGN